MEKAKVFIINYNRVGSVKKMVDYLINPECNVEVIIIDNNSSYEPLLNWYEKDCPVQVERMRLNYGNCVLYNSGLVSKYNLSGNYILTDSDLDLTGIPTNFLEVLQEGLNRFKWADKCGFSLEIDDLPNTKIANLAKQNEIGFWSQPLDNQYYKAAIDTTFSLFRTNIHSFECVRTAKPFCARHLPWYWTSDNMPEDERFYFSSIDSSFNYYSRLIKEEIKCEK